MAAYIPPAPVSTMNSVLLLHMLSESNESAAAQPAPQSVCVIESKPGEPLHVPNGRSAAGDSLLALGAIAALILCVAIFRRN